MDRFIGSSYHFSVITPINLKSSMDRFIVAINFAQSVFDL